MALADWEVILGGDLVLGSEFVVSGSRALTQSLNGGATHMVHSATYSDAPKNVEIRTWMAHRDVAGSSIHLYIGGIARKQSGANTYYYWFLDINIGTDESVLEVYFNAGYYLDGSQNNIVNEEVTAIFKDLLGDSWGNGIWRFVRMIGYESGGKFNVSIEMTPDITTPDPSNPPLDQLQAIASASLDIPTGLANGGACGIVVGNTWATSSTTSGEPYYDYTQLYY